MIKLPPCKPLGGYDPYSGESDFECGYERQDYREYDDYIEDCAKCLCSWDTFGGRINPKTNRKWPFIICVLIFGLPYRHQPRCGNCKEMIGKLKDDGRFEVAKCSMVARSVDPSDGTFCRYFRGKWKPEPQTIKDLLEETRGWF